MVSFSFPSKPDNLLIKGFQSPHPLPSARPGLSLGSPVLCKQRSSFHHVSFISCKTFCCPRVNIFLSVSITRLSGRWHETSFLRSQRARNPGTLCPPGHSFQSLLTAQPATEAPRLGDPTPSGQAEVSAAPLVVSWELKVITAPERAKSLQSSLFAAHGLPARQSSSAQASLTRARVLEWVAMPFCRGPSTQGWILRLP